MINIKYALLWLMLLFLARGLEAKEGKPIVSSLTSYGINLYGYEDALLNHIMSYDSAEQVITRYPSWLPRGREFALMAKNQGIDVVWGSATDGRFTRYHPVKIPIYRGLIGWRLALLKQNNRELLADVSSIDELRKFIPGQHHKWSDYRIYADNGFSIASGANRDALAEMLVLGRFDFFPRSVIEIEKELHDFAGKDIVLDPHLLIRYKSAYVFYVAKNNLELAEKLESGLRKAKADGSFDRLFEQHFSLLSERLDLPNRQVIQLTNPSLPQDMLTIEEHYWISPKALLD